MNQQAQRHYSQKAQAEPDCDTTSRLHGIGKGTKLKKFNNDIFCQPAEIFNQTDATAENVTVAAEKALVCRYTGNTSVTS